MSELKGTTTEKNLLTAFAGESQAANRYAFFAKKAQKEGYEQIAAIFLRSSDEERSHASALYKLMGGGLATIQMTCPAGGNGSTLENLKMAAHGEHEEWEKGYPSFAAVARDEGFPIVARVFDALAVAEEGHEATYQVFIKRIESGAVFKRETPVVWRCRKCGYLHEGLEAPEVCPACSHPQSYFEAASENW